MSDPIEEILETMPLRPPPGGLDRRVLRRRLMPAAAWAAVGAVLVAAGLFLSTLYGPLRPGWKPEAGRPIAASAWGEDLPPMPVRLEQGSSFLRYEGVEMLDPHTPVRMFRRQVLRNVIWTDDRGQLADEMVLPEQQVVLVAVETY